MARVWQQHHGAAKRFDGLYSAGRRRQIVAKHMHACEDQHAQALPQLSAARRAPDFFVASSVATTPTSSLPSSAGDIVAVLSSLAESGDLTAEVAARTPELRAAVAAAVTSVASAPTTSSLPVRRRETRQQDRHAALGDVGDGEVDGGACPRRRREPRCQSRARRSTRPPWSATRWSTSTPA